MRRYCFQRRRLMPKIAENQIEPFARIARGCIRLGQLRRTGAKHSNCPLCVRYLTRTQQFHFLPTGRTVTVQENLLRQGYGLTNGRKLCVSRLDGVFGMDRSMIAATDARTSDAYLCPAAPRWLRDKRRPRKHSVELSILLSPSILWHFGLVVAYLLIARRNASSVEHPRSMNGLPRNNMDVPS